MFLAKHEFQPCVVHDTLAQSGAQTINTLLQSIYIICNNRRRGGACYDTLEGVATLTWQTCEDKSFLKISIRN